MIVIKSDYQFPDKLAPIFQPAPYKVIHGGRGKGASWGFGRGLLVLGTLKKLFIVCAREIQRSIDESVKKLLEDQIVAMDYHEHRDEQGRLVPARYEAFDDEIRGSNGTLIVFVGVRTHVRKIKSMEGIDIFWAIEATHWSKLSWDIVIPTIRRDAPFGPFGQGSELWIDFNPELASDYTYMYWVGNPPEGTIVIAASWRDNPWFPDRLKKAMLKLKTDDYDDYLNIYEGKPRRTLKGAIYAKELAKAINDGRIGPNYKLNPKKPVDVSVDLGRADATALWFWQQIGTNHIAGHYYGNFGEDWSHYLDYMQNLKVDGQRLIIRTVYLPHDGKNKVIQARLSVAGQTRQVYTSEGQVQVVKVPASKSIPINLTRQLFPRVCIDEIECADGLAGLTHYRYGVIAETDGRPGTEKRSPEPLHDWASHPADGMHTYACGMRPEMIDGEEDDDERDETERPGRSYGSVSQSWMGS